MQNLWSINGLIGWVRFLLMRVIRFVILCATFVFPNVAASMDTSSMVSAMQEVGDARLNSASISILWASERVSEADKVSKKDCHVALRDIAEKQHNFRSLLLVNEDGQLYCDSYNRFNFFAADLSSRAYFLDSRSIPVGELKIHAPVVGKQSGIPFIPIATRSLGNETLVATFDPSRLIPVRAYCVTCGALVIHAGKVIAVSSQLNSANEDVAARLNFDGAYGQRNIELRGMEISIEWKRSELFRDLIYVIYQGEHASGAE